MAREDRVIPRGAVNKSGKTAERGRGKNISLLENFRS